MKICNSPGSRNQARSAIALRAWGTIALVLAAQCLMAQDKNQKDSNKSVGFVLSADANEKDLGLPIYPGARQHKDSSDDSPALHMGLWGGSSGFKLVLLKLESDDAPEKIAAFYRKALAQYGRVLNCSKTSATSEKSRENSKELTCDADDVAEGSLTLKAGTKDKQHAVAIQPNGKHSLFQLVYVEAPKSDTKND